LGDGGVGSSGGRPRPEWCRDLHTGIFRESLREWLSAWHVHWRVLSGADLSRCGVRPRVPHRVAPEVPPSVSGRECTRPAGGADLAAGRVPAPDTPASDPVVPAVLRRDRRVGEGRTPGFPRFKGRGWFDTVTWPRDGDGCRWDSQPESPIATYVRLQGIGHVRVHRHRPVRGRVKTVSLKREGPRWFVVLSCDDVPAGRLPATGAVAGIDMGVASLVTTSDGTHVANPRHLAPSAGRLATAQRDLARKKRGSMRRRKAVARVAALHAKVRRQRLDGVHKAALRLVRDYDVIVTEDLHVVNMTRRAAPRPDPGGGYLPNGAAAKSGLNRSVLDAGWGVFLRVLAYKAESAGRELLAVNPANTSRTCARCGHCAKENRLTQAKFACTACGHEAHADVNAAINILRAGLALRQAAEAA
jgi:putative transposase